MEVERESARGEVEVRKLGFRRGSRQVFEELSCRFPAGRISVVLGASGSGKTTLLRLLSSLIRPSAGEIWIDGQLDLARMGTAEARDYRRSIGMMFQAGALLNSMTVFDNVALPLREHSDRSESEIRTAVEEVFESVGLEGVDALLPGELSGGMVKRAALARALILQPRILLCDEPFSGLDPSTVRLVEALLVQVNRRYGPTMIVTSHHIESTLRMADHVVVITAGGAVEGTPEMLRQSTHPQVMEFFSSPAGAP
jgi:phospholipid/cholesterol/gamma-HCH transport system ATP-binding protein